MGPLFGEGPPRDNRFDSFWLSGPWQKLGKEIARKKFKASVRSEKDWADIQIARDKYAHYLERERVHFPSLNAVHGKTFFHNWLEWFEFEYVERVQNGRDSKDERIARAITAIASSIHQQVLGEPAESTGLEIERRPDQAVRRPPAGYR